MAAAVKDDRAEFKRAFRERCRLQGISVKTACDNAEALLDSLQKEAEGFDPLSMATGGISKGLSHLGNAAMELGPAVYIGAPLAAGAAAGYGLAKLKDVADEDPAEVRSRETADTYRRLAQEMTIQNRIRHQQSNSRAYRPLVR